MGNEYDPKSRSSDQLRGDAASGREESSSETTDRGDRSEAGDRFVAANKELERRGEK